ncbi:MAG TPA: hypothetical protein VHJ20_05545 [Polyangia bacterium]|nr:hypothetical protein [Polyangia bacterium]
MTTKEITMRLTSMCAWVGLVAAVSVTGCKKPDGGDEFRAGVPTRETVALVVAGAPADGAAPANAGGVTTTTSMLLGQKADTYTATRVVTGVVNGGTWAVLTLVKTIVEFPPTSVDVLGQTAVWGPHTDPLSPNTWRLTVKRLAAHDFQWLLEARAKTADDSAFKTIISGTHTADVASGVEIEGFGSGMFTIDWDAAATLPEHDANVGKAAFTYAHALADGVVHVTCDFTGIQDATTKEIFNAEYRYVSTPGAGGELRYAEDKNNVPTTAAKEHFTFHSRWTEQGAGRSDLADSGGDLGSVTAHASECWDSNFSSVYMLKDYDTAAADNWGAESSCDPAFPSAVYAGL